MNFAPYASPPSSPPAASSSKKPNWFASSSGTSNYKTQSYQAGGDVDTLDGTHASSSSGNGGFKPSYDHIESGALGPEAYETRFGWRVDLEAMCAYAAGPLLAFVLLVLETHNSYVRFHAYQSLLFCSVLGILHLIFIWSRFFSFLLFFTDVGCLGYLAFKAYEDGHDLVRLKLPIIGEYADRWVEEE